MTQVPTRNPVLTVAISKLGLTTAGCSAVPPIPADPAVCRSSSGGSLLARAYTRRHVAARRDRIPFQIPTTPTALPLFSGLFFSTTTHPISTLGWLGCSLATWPQKGVSLSAPTAIKAMHARGFPQNSCCGKNSCWVTPSKSDWNISAILILGVRQRLRDRTAFLMYAGYSRAVVLPMFGLQKFVDLTAS